MDKTALKHKILTLEGLTNEEKSALLELLNKQKKYGLVWEEKPEDVEERLRDSLPVFKEVKDRAILSDSPEAPNDRGYFFPLITSGERPASPV